MPVIPLYLGSVPRPFPGFVVMDAVPRPDEAKRPTGEGAVRDASFVNSDQRLMISVRGVIMRWQVISPIHRDHDAVELAQSGHRRDGTNAL